MGKIIAGDGVGDIFQKMSEGNPMALTTCFEIMKSQNIDYANFFPLFTSLDMMGLYGDKLYKLWNQCCSRNIKEVLDVIEYFLCGEISKSDIEYKINTGESFKDLIEEANNKSIEYSISIVGELIVMDKKKQTVRSVEVPIIQRLFNGKQQLISFLENKIKERMDTIKINKVEHIEEIDSALTRRLAELTAYQEVLNFVNKSDKDE